MWDLGVSSPRLASCRMNEALFSWQASGYESRSPPFCFPRSTHVPTSSNLFVSSQQEMTKHETNQKQQVDKMFRRLTALPVLPFIGRAGEASPKAALREPDTFWLWLSQITGPTRSHA